MTEKKSAKKPQATPPRIRRSTDKDTAQQKASESQQAQQPASVPAKPEVKKAPKHSVSISHKPVPEAPVESNPVNFADKGATTDDFEALLAMSNESVLQRRYFDVGDVVQGEIISIGPRYIFVALDGMTEGVADREDFQNEEGELELKVGDSKEFYVLSTRGGISLGKELGRSENPAEALAVAFESGIPVQGRVSATNKGGYDVDVQGVRVFCPISQIDVAFTEDPEVHLGQTYRFRVTDFREGGKNIIVSRAALIREEREAMAQSTLDNLEIGQTIDGVVSRIADFGVFVDLGGVDGLVHITELSHTFFDHPSEMVSTGDKVKVEVLSIEQADNKQTRIGLSMKATEVDPWLKVNDLFGVGQKVTGTVIRLAPFGAFVEIAPGIEGLVHVSEMSWERHVATPRDIVSVGQELLVEIQDIDLMRKRIGLSMKAAEGDPWANIEERYPLNMQVNGTVENVEDFGVFVRLTNGVTGLIPRSEIDLPRDATPHRVFTKGTEIQVRILNVEPERRRLTLTQKSAEEIAEARQAASDTTNQPTQYVDNAASSGGFGTLGDLLKDKFGK